VVNIHFLLQHTENRDLFLQIGNRIPICIPAEQLSRGAGIKHLPKWGLSASAHMTKRLLQMLATLHGQPLNASRRIVICRIASPFGNDQLTVTSPEAWLKQL
jgi:hypothetical protein